MTPLILRQTTIVRLFARLLLYTLLLSWLWVAPAQAQLNSEGGFYGSNIFFFDPNASAQGSGELPGTCGESVFEGSENKEIVWNYLKAKGFSDEQTAGFVGNFAVESGFDPNAVNNAGSGATGLAQWLGGRLDRLYEFADAQNRSRFSLETQLDFVWFELTGEPEVPGVAGGYESGAYNAILATTSVEEAVRVVDDRYERSGGHTIDRRITEGLQAYAEFTGTGGGPPINGCVGEGGIEVVAGDTTHILCQAGTDVTPEGGADGYADGNLYKIRICNVQGIVVNSQISGYLNSLLLSAEGSGIDFGGGGFRTMEQQIEARVRNGCPDIYNSPASSCRVPTARPGYSNHQMGLAVDFTYNGSTICFPNSASYCRTTSNAGFHWLDRNAVRFGLINLPTEAWHWSVDGH